MAKGKIFKKPAGPAELGPFSNGDWATLGTTTCGPLCEPCGTEHEEIDENEPGLSFSRVMGLQLVDECCGAAIDTLYKELGEPFALRFLEEFAKNPAAPQFQFLLRSLKDVLDRAIMALAESRTQVQIIKEKLSKLQNAINPA
jgi:hypothetical protein